MNQNQISPEDPRLTLYALGEMEPQEKAGFEKLLEQDPAARQVVADIRATADTVMAALEQEPAEAPAKPAGKVLRFPQAYFIISGLAAACFAVVFTVWQNQQQFKKEKQLVEVSLVAAKEKKDGAAVDGSVSFALPAPAAAAPMESPVPTAAPVPQVTLELAQASPMPPTLPLQDSYRSASNTLGADVSSARTNAAQENRERQLSAAADQAFAFEADKRKAEAGYAAKSQLMATGAPPPEPIVTGSSAPAEVAAIEPNAVAFAEDPSSTLTARAEEPLRLDAFQVSGDRKAYTTAKRAANFGRTGLVSQPALKERDANTEAYAFKKDNDFLRVADNPLSTFSIDVDTASYTNVRRFLQQSQRPPADAVRIEELVNYFPYDYAAPVGSVPFAASLEVAGAPWAPDHRLVRIGLKGREVTAEQRPAANLVFLLDVSGSMNQPKKLPLVKQSLRLLVNQLRADDRVAIAVYAGASGLALPSTSAREKAKILAAIDELTPGGSTNGAMGIHLAYDIAKANFVTGGVNRVILATDGDFNVGTTSEGELVRLIGEKAQSGVFLSVLGFGMGNLKDSTLEQLADKGNGNYAYIDSLAEARKSLVEQAGGTLVTIAKDVKIQVEFNPARVQAYRLIGYENRMLAKEDFNNDKVDAGEIGAGHTVTALYEVVPAGAAMPEEKAGVDALRYQPVRADQAARAPGSPLAVTNSHELLTVKIRYKEPTGDVSSKLEFPLVDTGARFADASPDFKFAAAVAGFGMTLRDSPHKGQLTLNDVSEWGRAGLGQDAGGYRAEFLTLVDLTRVLLR